MLPCTRERRGYTDTMKNTLLGRNLVRVGLSWLGMLLAAVPVEMAAGALGLAPFFAQPVSLVLPVLVCLLVGRLLLRPTGSLWGDLLSTQSLGLVGLLLFAVEMGLQQGQELKFVGSYLFAYPVFGNTVLGLFGGLDASTQMMLYWVPSLIPGLCLAIGLEWKRRRQREASTESDK
ncbi:MAG: hypothetical protein ACO1RX_14910 [Candidatus Sericytochromatia bacterium]